MSAAVEPYVRGTEIHYTAHPGAVPEYGFVERDSGGATVLCRFWHSKGPARLRTVANGEQTPRGAIQEAASGFGEGAVLDALRRHCSAPVSTLDATEPPGCIAGSVTTRADVAPPFGTDGCDIWGAERAAAAVEARASAHPGGLPGVLADDAVAAADEQRKAFLDLAELLR